MSARTISRRLAAAAAAALFSASPAFADAVITPPPEKLVVAPGGVDMRSGRYVYEQTDLAIGGDGGLALTRQMVQQVVGHNNPFGNFSHNWDILVSEKRIHIHDGIFKHVNGPDYQIEVNYGGRSETFRAQAADTSFDQLSRSGHKRLTYTGDKASAATVYTLTTGDGAVAVFRPIGSNDCSSVLRCAYVSEVTEADGTRLSFEYANDGNNATRLRSVTSNHGYALLLEYSGSRITRACVINLSLMVKPSTNVCPANAQATANYSYSGGLMVSATDAANRVWGFTYSGGMGFVRPGETAPWLVNSFTVETNNDGLTQEIVYSQQFADGSGYSYQYDRTPLTEGQIPQIIGGSYTDHLGNVTEIRYDIFQRPRPQGGFGDVSEGSAGVDTSIIIWDATAGPARVVDPLGRTTLTDYCDPTTTATLPYGQCYLMPVAAAVTDPEGIRTEYSWDLAIRTLLKSRQIPRPGSALPAIDRLASYDCTPANFRFCTKPVTATDPRGHVTDILYSPTHGGVTKETQPAAPVRLADGSVASVRPQTRTSYVQRYAWISNGNNGYVQAALPVWLPSQVSSCRTSAATGNASAPCATAGDEVRTTFDYGPSSGPNTLLLRGQVVTADGVSLRTCYSYDALGRKISETQPNANPGSCP